MSATMARQGWRVQLEQSDMRLAWNIVKMANGGFSQAAIEKMQLLIKIPSAEVREEKKRGVEFPGHRKLKAAMERHPALVRENQMDGFLPCRNCIAMNLQTRLRWEETGASPPDQVTPPPGMPPVPPRDNDGAKHSAMDCVPPGYVYIHTPLPNAQFLNLDAFAKDWKRDEDCIPDLLTDEGTSTG